MSHAFAGQLALVAGPGAPVTHGLTPESCEGGSSDVIDEHETRTMSVGDSQMVLAVSDRELAQTERLRSIRPQPSAIGLEVAQTVADAVRIGVHVGRVCLDVAECDAALGG